MSKQIDWIARAFLACAVVAACELAFGQDDYENVVLGRAASSDFDQNVPSPLGSLQTPGNSPSLNAAPAPDATIESSAVAASSSTNAAGDIVVRNAKVEVPKGEGYEALISANGQGLLDELRLYNDDYDLGQELQKLSESIAKEIANDQAQDSGATVKAPDEPESAAETEANALAAVARQFELLSKFEFAEKNESERPQLTRGMVVKKGQYLGRLQDDELKQEFVVALQELLVARKEAEKTLEVDVAYAAAEVGKASYRRATALNKSMPGAISPEEIDEKKYDWIRANKSVEKAQYDLEVNREKVKVSLARANATMVQIRNRKLRSPIDGFIDEIYQNEGQWVREGDQILHILRLDKVQVTGTIDASQYAPEDVDGKTIFVTVRRPGAEPVELTGKIVYVRQVIESGCYYFYADVENKTVRNKETGKDYWLLNPGSLVTVTIKAK